MPCVTVIHMQVAVHERTLVNGILELRIAPDLAEPSNIGQLKACVGGIFHISSSVVCAWGDDLAISTRIKLMNLVNPSAVGSGLKSVAFEFRGPRQGVNIVRFTIFVDGCQAGNTI